MLYVLGGWLSLLIDRFRWTVYCLRTFVAETYFFAHIVLV